MSERITFERAHEALETLYEAACDSHHGDMTDPYACLRAVICMLPKAVVPFTFDPSRCNAGRDGDCIWPACPQLRDNEPHATRRHCPLDVEDEEY